MSGAANIAAPLLNISFLHLIKSSGVFEFAAILTPPYKIYYFAFLDLTIKMGKNSFPYNLETHFRVS